MDTTPRELSAQDLNDLISKQKPNPSLESAIVEETLKQIEDNENANNISGDTTKEDYEAAIKESFDKGFNEGYTKATYDIVAKVIDSVNTLDNVTTPNNK